MNFKPVQRLTVMRTLSTGETTEAGTLVQNRTGVFFQYHSDYLRRFGNSSPVTLENSTELQRAPINPHNGLHGLFADSLPDGWGRLLQDRVFRQQGIALHNITAMDRLAFVGHRGMGAFSYYPESDYQPEEEGYADLITLGKDAQAVFEGETDVVLSALVAAGSSGGARPKAQLYFRPGDFSVCSTGEMPGSEAWLVKFTSASLPLGHDEGLCEAVYLDLAGRAGLNPPQWRLIDTGSRGAAKAWLAVKRFDRTDNSTDECPGRLLMHSVCGLLDADFRIPSLDYEDLIRLSRMLCRSVPAGQLQFRRAVFNLLAANQDDHTKNWSFLQSDDGQWQAAPFYDVTYNPNGMNEHTMAFGGYGRTPPLKTMKYLAELAGFDNWETARQTIAEISDVVAGFPEQAKIAGVSTDIRREIESTLTQRRQSNQHLLSV